MVISFFFMPSITRKVSKSMDLKLALMIYSTNFINAFALNSDNEAKGGLSAAQHFQNSLVSGCGRGHVRPNGHKRTLR